MQFVSKYFMPFILLAITFFEFGCKQAPTSYQKNENTETLAAKMILSNTVPREALTYTVEDYKELFQNEIPVLAKRMAGDETVMSMDELSEAIDSVDAEYPIFKDSLPDETINRIRSDFPGVSDEEIGANAEEIISLYQTVKTYEVFQVLKEEGEKTGFPKISSDDYFGTGLNSQEFWLLFFNSSMKNGTEIATNEAMAFASEKFPGEALWMTRGDGFRHAIWNSLIAKYTGDKHSSVSAATDWAKKFTDAHENGASTQPTDTRDNPMDFHNNASGRTYFASVASVRKYKSYWLFGWHYGYDVSSPETGIIKSAIYSKTLAGARFSNISQLTSLAAKIVWIK